MNEHELQEARAWLAQLVGSGQGGSADAHLCRRVIAASEARAAGRHPAGQRSNEELRARANAIIDAYDSPPGHSEQMLAELRRARAIDAELRRRQRVAEERAAAAEAGLL